MPREMRRLLQKDIAKLGPGMHADGGGLYLAVAKSAAGRSWIFRYRKGGALHDRGLGSAYTFTLAQARQTAQAYRADLWRGNEPRKHRETHVPRSSVTTFADAAERYIEDKVKPASRPQWLRSLQAHAFPVIGKTAVADVDLEAVLRVLQPLWVTKTETASRIRTRIDRILGWAATMGYRTGDNPARWKGHLENLLMKKSDIARTEHHGALPYAEIAGLVADLRSQDGVAVKALEFLILTAARAGEVIGARWSEIDLHNRWWVIPGERMKGEKEHRVPLSDRALAILAESQQRRVGEFVFPGARSRRPLGSASFNQLLNRIGRRNGETIHGFRSSFRDWAAEQTEYPPELAEMALAHEVGTKVEQAYRRGDGLEKRRALMADWASWCAR